MQALRDRSASAWTERMRWTPLLDEIHKFVMPWLARGGSPASTGGLYDSTAVHSAVRFGTRLQNDVLPPGQMFFDLAAGPLIEDERQIASMNAALQRVSKVVMAVLQASNFETASGEACMALGQGTAALLGVETGDERLLAWLSVPIQEIALREGPFGDVEGVYWKRKWRVADVPRLFRIDVDKLPSALKAKLQSVASNAKTGEELIEVRQDTEWDADKRLWRFTAWTELDAETPIVTRDYRRTRWITPRFLKMPGEVMGRGPAMLALPNAKTLHSTMGMVLKAAALGLFGVHLWRDDGVFNPDSAPMKPGALWKVSGLGQGMFGAPIQPLQTGRNFDISNIVISDQREQVRLALYDEALPDLKESVRSPTELMERLRRSYRDHAAATGRLVREMVKPIVELVIDVLEERGLLPTQIKIDQLGTKLQLTSPLARAQALENVQRIVEGMQILATVAPQETDFIVSRERAGVDVVRALGWAEENLLTPDERDERKKGIQDMVTQQAMAEMAPPAPPKPPALRAVA